MVVFLAKIGEPVGIFFLKNLFTKSKGLVGPNNSHNKCLNLRMFNALTFKRIVRHFLDNLF